MPANIHNTPNNRQWYDAPTPHQRWAHAAHQRIMLEREERIMKHPQKELARPRPAKPPALVRALQVLRARRRAALRRLSFHHRHALAAVQPGRNLARRLCRVACVLARHRGFGPAEVVDLIRNRRRHFRSRDPGLQTPEIQKRRGEQG